MPGQIPPLPIEASETPFPGNAKTGRPGHNRADRSGYGGDTQFWLP
jgi:hypothetical protein